MKKLLFILALLSQFSFSQSIEYEQVTPKKVEGKGKFFNSAYQMMDGVAVPDATPNTDPRNVRWTDVQTFFVFELGPQPRRITDLIISCDYDDEYLLEFSLDKKTWKKFAVIKPEHGNVRSGMKTLSSRKGDENFIDGMVIERAPMKFIKVSATKGDGNFAISEIKFFISKEKKEEAKKDDEKKKGIESETAGMSFEDGTLVKAKDGKDIYLIMNNKKLYIPSLKILEVLGFKSNQVQEVSKDILDKLASQPLIVKVHGREYFEIVGESKKPLSPQEFDSKKYDDAAVYVIPKQTLDKIPDDKALIQAPAPTFKDGDLVKAGNDIFLIMNNKKIYIPAISVFNALGFEMKNVREIDKAILDKLESHPLILITPEKKGKYFEVRGEYKRTLMDGEFEQRKLDLKCVYNVNALRFGLIPYEKEPPKLKDRDLVKVGNDIYLIMNNKKIYIESMKVFDALGFKMKDVKDVDKSVIDQLESHPLILITPAKKGQYFEVKGDKKRTLLEGEFEQRKLDLKCVWNVDAIRFGLIPYEK